MTKPTFLMATRSHDLHLADDKQLNLLALWEGYGGLLIFALCIFRHAHRTLRILPGRGLGWRRPHFPVPGL